MKYSCARMLDSTLRSKDHQRMHLVKRQKRIQKKLNNLETSCLSSEHLMLTMHLELLIEPTAVLLELITNIELQVY